MPNDDVGNVEKLSDHRPMHEIKLDKPLNFLHDLPAEDMDALRQDIWNGGEGFIRVNSKGWPRRIPPEAIK